MSSRRRNFTQRRVRNNNYISLGALNVLKIRFLQRYLRSHQNANLAHQSSLSVWAEIKSILDPGFGEVAA